jgi:two-component system response regulator HydG
MNASGHILIVDDETSLRQTLARILQRAGFEVTTAAAGNEALALLTQQSFDLIYLDIRMPDISGLEVLKTIHAKLLSYLLFYLRATSLNSLWKREWSNRLSVEAS